MERTAPNLEVVNCSRNRPEALGQGERCEQNDGVLLTYFPEKNRTLTSGNGSTMGRTRRRIRRKSSGSRRLGAPRTIASVLMNVTAFDGESEFRAEAAAEILEKRQKKSVGPRARKQGMKCPCGRKMWR